MSNIDAPSVLGWELRPHSVSKLKPVSSSSISHVGHDPQTQTLTVKFANGGLYHYDGVPASEHDALMSAPSVGKHFAERIRNKYSARKA